MHRLFDSKAKMHDIILSNVTLLAVFCVLFNWGELIVVTCAVLSPVWYRLAAMWTMLNHPAVQRSLWNRYG